jgi:hypothetical protein
MSHLCLINYIGRERIEADNLIIKLLLAHLTDIKIMVYQEFYKPDFLYMK